MGTAQGISAASKTDVVITAHLRALRAGVSDVPLQTGQLLRGTTMIANDYEAAVVVLLGTAADIIRGATKGILVDDAPNQDWRTLVLDDSE